MRKINVAYNNAFRMIMQLPRYCSASNMFAMCNVPSCQAVMRNLVYRFTIRVDRSGIPTRSGKQNERKGGGNERGGNLNWKSTGSVFVSSANW